jgi:hypothetical protein
LPSSTPQNNFKRPLTRSTAVRPLYIRLNLLVARGSDGNLGPRPERHEFLPRLERAFPDYRRRLAVRPGVTGLAQVQQPPDTGLDSARRKLNYDLCYVDGLRPWLDLRIVLATPLKCLGVPFAWIGVVLRLPDAIGPSGPDIPSRKETVRPEALALEAHPGAQPTRGSDPQFSTTVGPGPSGDGTPPTGAASVPAVGWPSGTSRTFSERTCPAAASSRMSSCRPAS